MAVLPCVITLGQSNSEGHASILSMTDANMNRLLGTTATTIVASVLAKSYPVTVPQMGIKEWTCKMPMQSVAKTGTVTAGGTSTNLLGSGFATTDDEKIAVILRGTTAGMAAQVRRVSAYASATELTVDPAWTVTPDATCQYLVAFGGVTTTATSTVATVTSGVDWTTTTLDPVGKVLAYVNGTAAGQMRIISAKAATTLTVSTAFSPAPTTGDAFIIYDSGTLNTATYTGTFRDRSLYIDTSPVYATGYEYTNWMSMPAYRPTASSTNFGPGLELGWQMLNHQGKQIYWIHLAVDAAYLSVQYQTLTNTEFSWLRNAYTNDWSPASLNSDGTPDLYSLLADTILPAAVADVAAGGDELDVIGVFTNEGESDAFVDTLYLTAGQNMARLRDSLRQKIEDLGMTQRSAGKIPWIIGGMTTGWSYADEVTAQFAVLAQDDPYTGYVDASTFSQSANHFDGTGTIDFGAAFFDKWKEIVTRDTDATSPETTRWSLAQIRAEVKSRYEGNSVNTDSTDARINRAINDAQRSIVNRLGHAAWFLRRTETMNVTADQYTPFTMPAVVGNLLQIRDSTQPHRELKFNMIGHTAEGRIQIVMPWADQSAGSVIVDFMARLIDLAGDGDYTPIPYEYIELLVLEAVARLAERGGNISLAASCKSSAAEQWAGVWRRVNAQDRSRNSTWHVDPDGTKNRSWNVHDGAWGWGMI